MTTMKTLSSTFVDYKAVDDTSGRFTAIVSVFGNVDYMGERVLPTAFDATLAKWRDSGDPIPVIWSHRWDDPDAFIGSADPADVVPLPAGHPDLPDTIRDLGGLSVTGTIDTSDPIGAKVLSLMRQRVVKEFSFAFEVIDSRMVNGVRELTELDLFEVGPTLKGANDLTQLVAASRETGATTDDKAPPVDDKPDVDEASVDVVSPAPNVVRAMLDIDLLDT